MSPRVLTPLRRKQQQHNLVIRGTTKSYDSNSSFSGWIRTLLIVSVFAASFLPLYFYQFAGLDLPEHHLQQQSLESSLHGATVDTNRIRSKGVHEVASLRRSTLTTGEMNANNNINKQTTRILFAYVFLIGGIHEDRPAYKGFLFNVLIANQILRKTGSRADFWLLVQFSPDSSLTDSLPDEDVRLLEALNIRVRVLPKPQTAESFSEVVYEKFRILQMIHYRRVMFLDADIIPLANLDYLFDLSLSGTLRPNLIVATRGEPCNAGLFILEPTASAWDELQQVILDQHESAKDLPYPKFDRVKGWGHSFIDAGDEWTGIVQKGRRWQYHASHSDQGLLFYWAKYLKQDTSIVIGNRIENWVSHETWQRQTGGVGGDASSGNKPKDESQPVKLSTLSQEEVVKFTSVHPLAYQQGCDKRPESSFLCYVPYRDYAHFSGKAKPWQQPVDKIKWQWSQKFDNINKVTDRLTAPSKLWFQELRELNEKLEMKIDDEFWAKHNMTDSPLGYMAMFKDHHDRVSQFHNTATTKE